jgi:hypothetical protein
MDADTFEKIEATPLAWATLDEVFHYFQHRRYGEAVILIRVDAEVVVFEDCDSKMLRKAGKGLLQLAKSMEEEEE